MSRDFDMDRILTRHGFDMLLKEKEVKSILIVASENFDPYNDLATVKCKIEGNIVNVGKIDFGIVKEKFYKSYKGTDMSEKRRTDHNVEITRTFLKDGGPVLYTEKINKKFVSVKVSRDRVNKSLTLYPDDSVKVLDRMVKHSIHMKNVNRKAIKSGFKASVGFATYVGMNMGAEAFLDKFL